MAALWLATALHAYASIFPRDSPPPELGDLAETLRRDLHHPRGRGLVMEETHGITGMVVVRPWPGTTTTGQLARLYVAAAHWGRGLGGRLHDAAVAELAALGFADAKLWVLRDNERARAFYQRRGWKLTDETTTTGDTDVEDVQYRLVL